jgi:hypothetical protein
LLLLRASHFESPLLLRVLTRAGLVRSPEPPSHPSPEPRLFERPPRS